MSLRLATTDDAAALSRLHVASFDDGWSQDDFVTWLARRESMAVLAVSKRDAVANGAVAFGLALEAGADAELLSIATDPGARRAGWGRQIFLALDREAHKRGLARWVLEVARNNLSAIGLYKSLGFVEIGVRKAYYAQREGRVDALVLAAKVGAISGQDGG